MAVPEPYQFGLFEDRTQLRTCVLCGVQKPLTLFARQHRRGDPYRPVCRACHNVYHRDYYRAQRAQGLGGRQHLARFGLTPATWRALLAAQDGKCAACGERPAFARRYHVDHDHRTGAIRGILCHGCNTALGLVGDSPQRLRLLIAYLERTAPN